MERSQAIADLRPRRLIPLIRRFSPWCHARRCSMQSFSFRMVIALIGVWLLGVAITPAHAQNSLDAFDPNPNAGVFALAQQTDGKLVLGGFFGTVGGTTRNRVARLNSDGSLDSAFDPNANGGLYGLALQADGKVVLCGQFTMMGGTTRNHVARINSDGGLDTAFDPNANDIV